MSGEAWFPGIARSVNKEVRFFRKVGSQEGEIDGVREIQRPPLPGNVFLYQPRTLSGWSTESKLFPEKKIKIRG